jgi:predicted dehydrogenase
VRVAIGTDVKGGGGIFKDMAVHDLDMARFLVGSEPVEILAMGSCKIDTAIEVRHRAVRAAGLARQSCAAAQSQCWSRA